MISEDSICQKAYAKINLTLEVLNRLPDGYHEIKSVMQQVELHDEIWIRNRNDSKILLRCDKPEIPLNQKNLVWQVVELIRENNHLSYGVEIDIIKRIPVAGGLAGGSSNAAATIKALNRLWKLELSQEQMLSIGEILGMDIPYCLIGGTALATGKGQVITSLPPLPKTLIVVVNPGVRVSTRDAYTALDDFLNWNEQNDKHSNGLVNALKSGQTTSIYQYFYNDFQKPLEIKLPVVSKIVERMLSLGAYPALLSGSGPSVYCIVKTMDQADKIAVSLRDLVSFVAITSTFDGDKELAT